MGFSSTGICLYCGKSIHTTESTPKDLVHCKDQEEYLEDLNKS